MNTEELNEALTAIFNRGDPKYTTLSGAFLEFLRERAKNGEIKEIAEVSVVYCKSYPEAKPFIAACIPGILANHYFTIRKDLNYDAFIQFSINTENWAEGIKETIFSTKRFASEIEKIIKKANDFAPKNPPSAGE